MFQLAWWKATQRLLIPLLSNYLRTGYSRWERPDYQTEELTQTWFSIIPNLLAGSHRNSVLFDPVVYLYFCCRCYICISQTLKMFPHSVCSLFLWMIVSFARQKRFSFMRSQLSIIDFNARVIQVIQKGCFLSSIRFGVLIRSYIEVPDPFEAGICSRWEKTLLYFRPAIVQLDHYLLEMLSSLLCVFFCLLIKTKSGGYGYVSFCVGP